MGSVLKPWGLLKTFKILKLMTLLRVVCACGLRTWMRTHRLRAWPRTRGQCKNRGSYLATLLDYLNQAMSIIAAAGSTVLLYVRRSISHCTFGVPNDRKTRKMPTRRTVCPVFISYEKFLFHMKSFYFICPVFISYVRFLFHMTRARAAAPSCRPAGPARTYCTSPGTIAACAWL